jgi:hypothetical protein
MDTHFIDRRGRCRDIRVIETAPRADAAMTTNNQRMNADMRERMTRRCFVAATGACCR